MKLAIISHTEHYIGSDGCIVGWGPTVREINHLAPHFEKIYHVACLHKGVPPLSSLKYTGANIEFVSIPPSGGVTLFQKRSVIRTMPEVIGAVSKVIGQVDYFQVRLPTGIGNYLLPWLKIYKPQAKFWVKYAGNWVQKNPPIGYAFQRWFLTKNFLKCKVTVNGRWLSQPDHVLSFENPCLTDQERIEGEKALHSKFYDGTLDFVFVGQLTHSKGVARIIEAFCQLKDESRLGVLNIVGDGPDRSRCEKLAKDSQIRHIFHGFLPKNNVNKVLEGSHVLLLPSESEGFPKVVAEGANFGCVPVVSDISCLSQYITDGSNGYLLKSTDSESLKDCIKTILLNKGDVIKRIAQSAYDIADGFTYEKYYQRILQEIL